MNKKILKEGKWSNYCEIDGWEFIERKNEARIVTIIARYLDNGPNYVLIKQFRKPVNKYTIEFPAGIVDKNETIEKAALRELKEETGCVGTNITDTKFVCKSPGLTSELMHICFVDIIDKGEQSLQDDEKIEVIWVKNYEDILNLYRDDSVILSEGVLMWMKVLRLKI